MNEKLLRTSSLASTLLKQQDRRSSCTCCRSVCLDSDRASYSKTLTLRRLKSPAWTTRGRTQEPWRPHQLRQSSPTSSQHGAMQPRRHIDIEDPMVNGAGSLGFLGADFNMTVESLKETQTCCVAL